MVLGAIGDIRHDDTHDERRVGHPSYLWPASALALDSGDLLVGGVSMREIAVEYGTPAYILDTGEFLSRCEAYRSAFGDWEVAYAGKALLTRGVLGLVERAGLALDVCSDGELALAISAGFPAHQIILHGNGKSGELLRWAALAGVGRIVLDSIEEITDLAHALPVGVRQSVLLRLAPGIDAGAHPSLATAVEDQQFGLSIASGAAAEGVRRVLATPSLDLVGVHTHLGSQIRELQPYVRAIRGLIAFMAEVRDEHRIALPQLDLGGGHAIAYRDGEHPFTPGALAEELRDALTASCVAHRFPAPRITIEPGRGIAGPSGVTLYRVRAVKSGPTRTWVVIDGGMSDNPRPALYGARYAVRLIGRASTAAPMDVTVVGQHCESGDVLAEDIPLPGDLHVGDLLAVPATGAYHQAMASNYNMTPRAPLIGVDGGRHSLMVRRETFSELTQRDLG